MTVMGAPKDVAKSRMEAAIAYFEFLGFGPETKTGVPGKSPSEQQSDHQQSDSRYDP